MALLGFITINSKEEWYEFFLKSVELTDKESNFCADMFVTKNLNGQDVLDLIFDSKIEDNNIFGISMGHLAKTKRYLKKYQIPIDRPDSEPVVNSRAENKHSPKIPRPVVNMNIEQIDFDQFCFEWRVYKDHYKIQDSTIASNLLHCCDIEVRKRIRIEYPNFTINNQPEAELLEAVRCIALSKTSQIIHIKEFYNISQNETERCDEYLGRLQSKASCCGFKCEHCNTINDSTRVKERFIMGLNNKVVQTAILKSESVNPGTPLKKLLAEALTLEQSIKDQAILKTQDDNELNFLKKNYVAKARNTKKTYSNQSTQKKNLL